MYKKNRASPSRQINPHTSSDIYIKMYAIVPMYFTHTYTHLYIKSTLKVLVICSICGRNWGFSFQCHYHENWRKVPCRKRKTMIACGSLSQKDPRKAKT